MMPHGVIRHEFNRRGYYIITVTSHKHHGVSNHSQLDCFFNSLHTLATKKTPELPITGPLCRESTSDWWIPWQRVSNAKSFSMSWRLADLWLSIIKSVNRVSIGSDNGMSLTRRQTIILTNAGLLSFGPLGTNFSEILMKIQKFSLKKKCVWKYRLRNGGHFVQGEVSWCCGVHRRQSICRHNVNQYDFPANRTDTIGMMTSSNSHIFRVTGHLSHKVQWRGAFDVFFDLRPNKRLSKQSWDWWFETPSRPLWRHCNGTDMNRMWVQY